MLRHRYDDLIEAGVEIWELPGAVVHAKVVVADDVVSFGRRGQAGRELALGQALFL